LPEQCAAESCHFQWASFEGKKLPLGKAAGLELGRSRLEVEGSGRWQIKVAVSICLGVWGIN